MCVFIIHSKVCAESLCVMQCALGWIFSNVFRYTTSARESNGGERVTVFIHDAKQSRQDFQSYIKSARGITLHNQESKAWAVVSLYV